VHKYKGGYECGYAVYACVDESDKNFINGAEIVDIDDSDDGDEVDDKKIGIIADTITDTIADTITDTIADTITDTKISKKETCSIADTIANTADTIADTADTNKK